MYNQDNKRGLVPLDLAAVAFSLAHPAASRRIGFAMYEHSPKEIESGRYGNGVEIKEEDLIDPLPGTYCISGLNNTTDRCHSLDDALKFARDQINKAAGEELVTLEG